MFIEDTKFAGEIKEYCDDNDIVYIKTYAFITKYKMSLNTHSDIRYSQKPIFEQVTGYKVSDEDGMALKLVFDL